MTRRAWTKREDAIMRKRYPHERASNLAAEMDRTVSMLYSRAKTLGLRKTEAFFASPQSGRTGHDERGSSGRFPPGHAPANKGCKGWQAGGRSIQTQFPKGNRPQTWLPVGTEVIDEDGYHKLKVSNDRVPARFNWKFVHVMLWEKHHGTVPKGHAIVFKDGDRSRIDIDNLECISRAELMKRNTLHRYPKPITLAIQARGALNRQINKRTRKADEEQDRRPA